MLFVPLPLFATLFLAFLLGRFVLTRDMTLRAHQLFATLVALYAAQSLLSCLKWGYGIDGATTLTAILAPVLPAVAYLAYSALAGRLALWPFAVIALNWAAFAALPMLADPLILMTYLGFGVLLLRQAGKGADQLSLSPINDAREIIVAMCLTGFALIASGLTDVFLIVDFMRNDGRHAGLVLTFVQTAFALAIGVSAVLGRASAQPDGAPDNTPVASADRAAATDIDADIVARLDALFTHERLHRSEDLSLRRLARRLGLPDRQLSHAINRLRGLSVSQYVNEFRIKDACDLLATTDRTILDISLAAGFATKSNFNREFSRVTGQTPSRWRHNNAQQ